MNRLLILVGILIVLGVQNHAHAQYSKDGYLFDKKINAPRVRRPVAHELLLDPMERFLVVSYSSHPTVVVLYEIPSWETKATYNIPEWFDLSNSFVGPTGRFLFLDFARYSSKYRRVDLETHAIDTVECYDTPRGCVPKEGGVQQKDLFTKDDLYYITINKKNKRDLLIFKKQGK
ncbi:MAG: hypothetical protein PF489_06800 [Salinivirgaceae bacterium]|jgi:hypothetical protein|nr:hypothetical protein [Salinivirgaceae bacterium]